MINKFKNNYFMTSRINENKVLFIILVSFLMVMISATTMLVNRNAIAEEYNYGDSLPDVSTIPANKYLSDISKNGDQYTSSSGLTFSISLKKQTGSYLLRSYSPAVSWDSSYEFKLDTSSKPVLPVFVDYTYSAGSSVGSTRVYLGDDIQRTIPAASSSKVPIDVQLYTGVGHEITFNSDAGAVKDPFTHGDYSPGDNVSLAFGYSEEDLTISVDADSGMLTYDTGTEAGGESLDLLPEVFDGCKFNGWDIINANTKEIVASLQPGQSVSGLDEVSHIIRANFVPPIYATVEIDLADVKGGKIVTESDSHIDLFKEGASYKIVSEKEATDDMCYGSLIIKEGTSNESNNIYVPVPDEGKIYKHWTITDVSGKAVDVEDSDWTELKADDSLTFAVTFIDQENPKPDDPDKPDSGATSTVANAQTSDYYGALVVFVILFLFACGIMIFRKQK